MERGSRTNERCGATGACNDCWRMYLAIDGKEKCKRMKQAKKVRQTS